ncbi:MULTISPECIES: family 16 glycosylhydrolase [unclassified Lentimicrobium]|uniref:glycoside hydrolase family 16 protein n=1 Tax=unclassified Lentimicrobium TaxID=2677434 RepID=UPI00155781FA|nr:MULTISPECIES: glycoside hydrolase family 16 protein [unclassified Lentimicrobium]NPD47509.1 glycoside hydrolase family 16 protein [Lentimicrobium sp. S6]NPD84680.1 glycoside hydrolase family 16 protein [Lentimicrobium sp. L6]
MKTVLQILVILIIGMLMTNCDSNPKSPSKNEGEWKLVWQDDFNYSGLPDSTKWDYDTEGNSAGWGNNEAQHYTKMDKDNAWVEDGKLKITARKEKFEGKEFTSARLMSRVAWQYGKIEVRAKLPEARGTWSAIWMMPGGWSFNDGNWPDIGEIDIMEHVGHDLGVIHASAHSKDYQWQKNSQKTNTVPISKVHEQFHTYKVEWSPEVLKFYVDDQLYLTYENEGLGESKWPYDKPFYLLLNVAVGGAWGNVQGIDEQTFPQVMEVEEVKVFQLKN